MFSCYVNIIFKWTYKLKMLWTQELHPLMEFAHLRERDPQKDC